MSLKKSEPDKKEEVEGQQQKQQQQQEEQERKQKRPRSLSQTVAAVIEAHQAAISSRSRSAQSRKTSSASSTRSTNSNTTAEPTVEMIKIKRPKAIILDIEGTTTSASYYPSAVAPYIRNNTENYLRSHWNEEHVQSIVRDLRHQASLNPDMPKILDKSHGATLGEIQKSCMNHIEFLYRTNTTTIALLYFQMYVWLDGQMKGVLKTHIFRDVAEMIYKWKVEDRIAIYIYSSARADVQMLMFACTEYGSLLHLIDGHFDSKIGAKTTNETYNRIAQAISQQPQNIVFFTDDAKEARSAKNCGYKVLLVKRERKAFSPIETAQFDIVNSFDRIKFYD